MRSGPRRRAKLPVLPVSLAAMVLVTAAIVIPSVGAKAPESLRASARRLPGPGLAEREPQPDDSTVLVRFKQGVSTATGDRVLASRKARRVRTIGRTGFVKVDTAGRPAGEVVAELSRSPEVAVVQLDYARRATAVRPNDPFYQAGDQRSLDLMRMPDAWGILRSASSAPIAVIDTGVDRDTPDLAGRLRKGWDFVENDDDPSDEEGHGTMVAGLAAATANNGIGIAGTAWSGAVIPVRVLGANGLGFDSNIADGITWAADNGAKVINLSLSGSADSQVLRGAVSYAQEKGVLVVAAAGNDGTEARTYPAAFPGVVAVGATDDAGQSAWFSSYGSWVSVAAPGVDVVSTYPAVGPAQQYAIGSGTSFSSPLVAGVAALIRARNPSWTPAQVAKQLRTKARDAGPPGNDPWIANGIANGYASLGGAMTSALRGSADTNGVADRAVSLVGSASGTIGIQGDVDWLRTTLTAGSNTVTVTPPAYQPNSGRTAEMLPVVEVYDSGLRLRAQAEGEYVADGQPMVARATVSAPTNGTWYVAVRNVFPSRSPSTYTVRVTHDATAAAATTEGTRAAQALAIGDAAWIVGTSINLDQSGVSRTGQLRLRLNRVLDRTSLAGVTIKNGRTGAVGKVTVTWDATARKILVTPQWTMQPNTAYALVVPATVRDTAGHTLGKEFRLRFFTTA